MASKSNFSKGRVSPVFAGIATGSGALLVGGLVIVNSLLNDAKINNTLRGVLKSTVAAPGLLVRFDNPVTHEPEAALVQSVTQNLDGPSPETCVKAKVTGRSYTQTFCYT